jgi:hypothetical protein
MAVRKVLIHRYNNEPDILAVETNCCSDVLSPAGIDFDFVIVLPTSAAKTKITVFAEPASGQYRIRGRHSQKHWPGSPRVQYLFRVDLTNIRYTTLEKVKRALQDADSWVGQWTVKIAEMDVVDLTTQ